MSSKSKGDKTKSTPAAQPTISGQDAENSQILESDTAQPFEDVITVNATARVSYPCTIIDYATYQKDLLTLARYVTVEGYYLIGYPERLSLSPTDVLRTEYMKKCPRLSILSDAEIEDVYVTFERWNVPPDCLSEIPLYRDLNHSYGVGTLGRNAPGPLSGYSYLDELYVILEENEKLWVSKNSDEPARFWRSRQPVSTSREPVLPIAAGTGGGVGVLSSQQQSQPTTAKKPPTQDARFLGGPKAEITEPADKIPKTKSRVDRVGDPDHGIIRERDLRNIRLIMERNLARYLKAMLSAIAEVLRRVGISQFLLTVKTLADHAYEDARFGRHLVTMPLSPTSIFNLGKMYADLQAMTLWMVPPVRGAQGMIKTKFDEHIAYWRFWKYEGEQSFGFLSDTARREWHKCFAGFAKESMRVSELCDELLDIEDIGWVEEYDFQQLMPKFVLSDEEHFVADWDEPTPMPKLLHTPSDPQSSTTTSVSQGQKPSVNDTPATPLRGSGLIFGMNDGSPGSVSVASVTSQDSVTIEEMAEPWLLVFSSYSVVNPCTTKSTNQKGESDMVAKISTVHKIDWDSTLQLVEQLKKVHGTYKDAAIPWSSIIDPSLDAVILVRYRAIFSSNPRISSLSSISSRQMIKLLGRLCEASNWSTFQSRARDAIAKGVDAFAPITSNSKSWILIWQNMQKVFLMLSLLVPLFGRRVGLDGAEINSHRSPFAQFLRLVMPKNMVDVLCDRIYSVNLKQQEKNVSFGLPKDSREWTWTANVLQVITMLQDEVATEIETERVHEERMLMYRVEAAAEVRPPPKAVNAIARDRTETGADLEYGEYEGRETSSRERIRALYEGWDKPELSGIDQDRRRGQPHVKSHAYGKSGSGSPSAQLSRVIDRSESRQVRFGEEQGICFSHAADKTSCKFGDNCKYRHLDDTKPEDKTLLIAHLRAQAAKGPFTSKGTSNLHVLDYVDDQSVFGEAEETLRPSDASKED